MIMDDSSYAKIAIVVAVLASVWALYFGIVYGPKSYLWTDEGDYTRLARSVVQTGKFQTLDDPYTKVNSTYVSDLERSYRPFGIPYSIANLTYIFGDDIFAGHATVAIFMALASLATFLLARRLFGNLAAAIAVLLLIFSQLFWFYTSRVLTDGPQMFFAAMTLYAFFKVVLDKDYKWIWLGTLFFTFGGFVRYTFFSLGAGLALAAFFYRRELAAEAKKLKSHATEIGIAAALVLCMAVPFAVYQYEKTGSPLGLASGYFAGYYTYGQSDKWFYLENAPWVFSNVYVVLAMAAAGAYAALKRNKEAMTLALVVIVPLAIMTEILSWKEDRFAIFLLPAAFTLAAFALAGPVDKLVKSASGKKDFSSAAFVGILSLLIIYSATIGNLYADWGLYNTKLLSYQQPAQAGLLLKNLTAPGEWIMADGGTQIGSYSDRPVSDLPRSYEEFTRRLPSYNARYFLASELETNDVYTTLQQIQNGTGNPASTYYHLFTDAAKFRLVAMYNQTGVQNGQPVSQPVVFVFEKIG